MTEPTVPHRLEFSVEVPGTPDQVWDAIATAKGISAWMMPTDMEERQGGAVAFHMGDAPEETSEGSVTAWEPPHRLAYEEPNWAALAQQDPATVTPLVSEFLVEAQSGGTCVVRVVSSAFGSGADWEQEFFDQMSQGWTPMFQHLRLYLTHFPGQQATYVDAATEIVDTADAVGAAIHRALGVDKVGQSLDLRGANAIVEMVSDHHVLFRLTDPVTGMLAVFAFATGETTRAGIAGYLFSEGAAEYKAREQSQWQQWLEGLRTEVPSTR